MIGQPALDCLQASRVVVIGLGAVGSYAVEGLARAGVGQFVLVDFDVVTESNINRQLYALHSSLGQSKVGLACQRVRDINPAAAVQPMELFAHEDTFDKIFSGEVDLVIDAIDSFNPKVSLLAEASRLGLPLVSSMGAALRRDPSKVQVAPLHETHTCPLARRVRKMLRRRNAPEDFLCVYSTESTADLPDSALASQEESEPHYRDRGRQRRTLGSLPTLTGIFGLTAANTGLQLLQDRVPAMQAGKSG